MRAVVLRGGRLEVRETADPVPGEGELLLRTLATAMCASDVHFLDHHDAIPPGGPAGMVDDPDRHRRRRGHPQGRHHPVRRRPAPRGLVRHPRRDLRRSPRPAAERRPDHRPRRGARRARSLRRSEGPPRIVVHPNG